jgi:hypothetical protein
MTDIVERLRVNAWRSDGWNRQDAAEAADEIVRLRAERDRLKDGLNKIDGITMSMCLDYKDAAIKVILAGVLAYMATGVFLWALYGAPPVCR